MVCLGFEPWTITPKAQMNPLRISLGNYLHIPKGEVGDLVFEHASLG